MNDPDKFPVDVLKEREWLRQHKSDTGLSWSALAARSGIAQGTLSSWMTASYGGNSENVAREIVRYRQSLASQAEQSKTKKRAGLQASRGFISMPSADRITALLATAQGDEDGGEITVGATGPGTCKTITMKHYAKCVSNVWTVTLKPSTGKISAMVGEVARAIGGKPATGWVRQVSAHICDMVRNRHGLIVFDEANWLTFEALEEIRSWHDETGVGVCLLGNEELIATIRNGGKGVSRDAFARLNRRIAYCHIQHLPLPEDIEIFLDHWSISADAHRAFLKRVGLTPGAGGLGEVRQIIKLASLEASADGVALGIGHLQNALANRATGPLRIAA